LKKKYNVSTLEELKLAIKRKKETVKGYPVPVLNLNNEAMASTKKELINKAIVFSSNNDSPIFDINS
jgi:predicted double-glycine peptidase